MKADNLIETQAEPVDAPEKDINQILTDYDRELMRFKPNVNRVTWPTPIRKRVCIK